MRVALAAKHFFDYTSLEEYDKRWIRAIRIKENDTLERIDDYEESREEELDRNFKISGFSSDLYTYMRGKDRISKEGVLMLIVLSLSDGGFMERWYLEEMYDHVVKSVMIDDMLSAKKGGGYRGIHSSHSSMSLDQIHLLFHLNPIKKFSSTVIEMMEMGALEEKMRHGSSEKGFCIHPYRQQTVRKID